MTTATAETMFIAWGRWQRGDPNNLKISTLSIIGRCILEGAGASHSTVAGEPHMPKTVEIVEGCVLQMDKNLQRLCKHRYIGDEPTHVTMKKLRCTESEYDQRVNQAVQNLVNYLTENYS